jgi:hypothetical protein
MELDKMNESQLQTILAFTKSLVDFQTTKDETNLDDLDDLDLVEKQAREYAKRRESGYSKAENPEDSEIRDSVREWLKRSNRYRNL